MIDELTQIRLEKQLQIVTNKVHVLLGDPIDQLEGNIETEKVILEIPKAFTYLSSYLQLLSNARGKSVSAWGHHEECFKRKYKYQRGAMRCYLTNIIELQLHEDLHQLCNGSHPFLKQPVASDFITTSKNDLTDDLPF